MFMSGTARKSYFQLGGYEICQDINTICYCKYSCDLLRQCPLSKKMNNTHIKSNFNKYFTSASNILKWNKNFRDILQNVILKISPPFTFPPAPEWKKFLKIWIRELRISSLFFAILVSLAIFFTNSFYSILPT